MRTKLKRAVHSGPMESDTCLLLRLNSVTLGRSLVSQSLSSPLEMKHVGQTSSVHMPTPASEKDPPVGFVLGRCDVGHATF